MKIIATHSYSDLDAILGSFLVGEFLCDSDYEVKFFPANTVAHEVIDKVDYIVDFGKSYDPENGIFDHHGKFEDESSVSLIKSFFDKTNIVTNLDNLIEYVHRQDLTGRACDFFAAKKSDVLEFVSMHNILAALRDNGKDDSFIFGFFKEIFISLKVRSEKFIKVKESINKTTSFYNKIAIVKNGIGLETPYIWQNYPDIHIVIYNEGNNMGVIRRDGTNYDLRKLKSYIDEEGWFYHITGFIAAHGTKKAPAKTISKHSAEKLAEFVTKIFNI